MGIPCKILLADRNRHVRELLRRELTEEGYQVLVAKYGHEVWLLINGDESPYLLILDLEIPYLDELLHLARFPERQPPLPLIIHSFLSDYSNHTALPPGATFLEKIEDIERLKAVVAEVIGRQCPERPTPAGHQEI